jgi:hypothetical protein
MAPPGTELQLTPAAVRVRVTSMHADTIERQITRRHSADPHRPPGSEP